MQWRGYEAMSGTMVILMNLHQLIALDQHCTLVLNGSESLFWDGFMMTATSTVTWIPLGIILLYVIIKNNSLQEIFLILVMLILAVFVADQFSSSFCKPFFARYRPTQDPFLMYQIDVVNNYRGGTYGFISSHAANTFSLFVLVSLIIRDRRLTFWLFTWAALNAFSRVYLGVHYLGDILCGTIWGCVVGALLYLLFRVVQKKITTRSDLISIKYTSSGYLVSNVRILLTALSLTYFYIVFNAIFFN
jgi:undecaprenyl-diphosphatase